MEEPKFVSKTKIGDITVGQCVNGFFMIKDDVQEFKCDCCYGVEEDDTWMCCCDAACVEGDWIPISHEMFQWMQEAFHAAQM